MLGYAKKPWRCGRNWGWIIRRLVVIVSFKLRVWNGEEENRPGLGIWTFVKSKNKNILAEALGYARSNISEIIDAKEFRDRKCSPGEHSTKVIRQTRGIKDDTLKAKFFEKIHKDQITAGEVRVYFKNIKSAPRIKLKSSEIEKLRPPKFLLN